MINIYLQILLVPRAGVEPARLAASVFETDLSTDSNIWAFIGKIPWNCGAKLYIFFKNCGKNYEKRLKMRVTCCLIDINCLNLQMKKTNF